MRILKGITFFLCTGLFFVLPSQSTPTALPPQAVLTTLPTPLTSAALPQAASAGFLPQAAYADFRLPDYVRIGIHQDSTAGGNATAPSYQLYSGDGISVGFSRDGGYTHLYDFDLSGDKSTMNLSGYTFGKGHAVVTGRDAASLSVASERVAGLREAGYEPQLAYMDGWVLIVGLYGSADDARWEIDSALKPQFSGYSFSAEALSGRYVSVSIGSVRQFVFDASAGNLQARPIRSENGGPALIELNGKKYRGAIEVLRNPSGNMTAVNYISLDDYVYGVVPREIEASSHPEALKAQAVAARTFAVHTMGKHSSNGFDMCTTTHCQVYGGYASEDARANQAVDDTSGVVVMYEGAPAEVFYFSSSGGYTADIRHVWGGSREYPYLLGVEDLYESGKSYRYEWEVVLTGQDIRSMLADSNVNIGDITGVAATKTAAGGRVIEVTIYGTRGSKVYTNGSCRSFFGLNSQLYTVFANSPGDPSGAGANQEYTAIGKGGPATLIWGGRSVIGADGTVRRLRGNGGSAVGGAAAPAGVAASGGTAAPAGAAASGGTAATASAAASGSSATSASAFAPRFAYANFPARGTVFYFLGRGWGHGVGMSQEGAKGMADAGYNYKEILTHYFPGCEVG